VQCWAYMNDATNPQNAYPAFWRRSRLSPKVQRNNFLLLSSPLTTAIGTWKKRQPDLWMSAFVAGAGISQLGHQGLPTAQPRHPDGSRRRTGFHPLRPIFTRYAMDRSRPTAAPYPEARSTLIRREGEYRSVGRWLRSPIRLWRR